MEEKLSALEPRAIESVSVKAQETCRMLDTLQYYKWLESQGVDYSSVRGLAKLPIYYSCGAGFGKLLSVKLEDGSVTQLKKWPPFSDAVIFNRRHYCEDGGPTVPQDWVRKFD